MSDLAGGLVPLGSRTGSGTGGSKSNLSGGLIPLGNKSRPTASFDRVDFEEGDWEGGGSSSRGWDRTAAAAEAEEEGGEEGDFGLRREGSSSRLNADKKVRSAIFPHPTNNPPHSIAVSYCCSAAPQHCQLVLSVRCTLTPAVRSACCCGR